MNVRPSRYLAVAIAAFTLTGQLSSFVHFVAVQHVVCPDHGELIEVEHGARTAATGSEGLDHTALDDAADEHHGHGHGHCAMAAQLRQRTTLTQRCTVARTAAEPVRLAPADQVPRPAALALLRVAPKSSPPA